MRLTIGFAALALGFAAQPTAAQPPEIDRLNDADHAEVTALSTAFFNQIQATGVEQAVVTTFTDSAEAANPQLREIYRQIDQNCAVLDGIELAQMTDFGSRVSRRTYVTTHGNCFLKWEFMFVKRGVSWGWEGFSFESLNGTNWTLP